ncbi:benzoate 4-monooxygenase cytochrome P450 [Tothia fuscella]|uniref:Benzoate 4-monooxygenase cytochrome P450 n=1 Tax=Tothia fuscella TaxID=1048955 RepID=A0A9P4TVY7_9PEZI|nr:benzoate 4-monooxygenase cytochrome P450 [Tothia fuscella]
MTFNISQKQWPALGYPSLSNAIFICGTVFLLYHIGVTIYRLTLHPLAKYPGNFIEKISDWPLIFQCNSGDRHLRINALHEKYGSIVRIGPNKLSFNTLGALEAIHTNRRANVKRAEWYKTIDAPSGEFSTQSVIDKKVHAFRRRVLSHAFSEKAIRDAEQFIQQSVDTLIRKMGEDTGSDGWSTPKDFSIWATYYAFDFTGDLAFGSSFEMLASEENRYMPKMLMGVSWFLYWAGFLPLGFIWRAILGSRLMNYIPGEAAQDSAKFFHLASSRLSDRFAAEEAAQANGKESRRDIFHYILRGRDPETGLGLTRAQLNADAGLLIAAGSDGVGLTLSATLFYLLKNPSVFEKLQEEIRTSFSSLDEICTPKINQLRYLHAVFEETLRMTPAIPSPLPRLVERGGLDIDGIHIPQGIDVGVPHYSIHHNEAYFPQSWSFRPERWLEDKEAVSLAKRAFCAFSKGSMDCIGRPVAYLAMKLALAKLVYTYEIEIAGELTGGGGTNLGPGRERQHEYQMIDWLVGYRTGPIVRFRRRGS